jgi:hypothetical protein
MLLAFKVCSTEELLRHYKTLQQDPADPANGFKIAPTTYFSNDPIYHRPYNADGDELFLFFIPNITSSVSQVANDFIKDWVRFAVLFIALHLQKHEVLDT